MWGQGWLPVPESGQFHKEHVCQHIPAFPFTCRVFLQVPSHAPPGLYGYPFLQTRKLRPKAVQQVHS